ncbi:MAG: hypothetical protein V4663_07855 [Bacteroidota bacterium]
MIKYLPISLRVSFAFILCACLATPSSAQYNFYKYSFGVGTGITLPFADTDQLIKLSFANHISTNYYFTPYISAGVEAQFGEMAGGIKGQGNFSNTFMLINWNAKMHLGQFYDRFDRLNSLYWLARGLYAGAGVGFIRNNVTAFNYNGVDISGVNHGILFPFNVGLNLYLPDFYERDRWEFNFNMQFVIPLEDKLDGNINPNSNFNDVYNYFSVGVRYKFGTLGLDKRKGRIK